MAKYVCGNHGQNKAFAKVDLRERPQSAAAVTARRENRDAIALILHAALTPPWKQVSREVGRWTPFARRTRWDRLLVGIGRDHLAVEVPSRVSEHGHNDGKTQE
jgi:hypothetical protein